MALFWDTEGMKCWKRITRKTQGVHNQNRYFMDMVQALFFFLCSSAIILEINLAYFRLIYSSKVYIPLAESAKCWLFDQVRGIIQNACLFSTDLNKIFHIKDVYMQSTRENNSWTFKNESVHKFTCAWFLTLCCSLNDPQLCLFSDSCSWVPCLSWTDKLPAVLQKPPPQPKPKCNKRYQTMNKDLILRNDRSLKNIYMYTL